MFSTWPLHFTHHIYNAAKRTIHVRVSHEFTIYVRAWLVHISHHLQPVHSLTVPICPTHHQYLYRNPQLVFIYYTTPHEPQRRQTAKFSTSNHPQPRAFNTLVIQNQHSSPTQLFSPTRHSQEEFLWYGRDSERHNERMFRTPPLSKLLIDHKLPRDSLRKQSALLRSPSVYWRRQGGKYQKVGNARNFDQSTPSHGCPGSFLAKRRFKR